MSELKQTALGRVRARGLSVASVKDLLAVGCSRREDDVEGNDSVAQDLWRRFGKASRFSDLAASDLEPFGLVGFEAVRCLALVEIGRRAGQANLGDASQIETPDDAVRILRSEYRGQKKEYFLAMLLDAKNKLLRIAEIHVGTLTMSPVGGREVFREAVREGASAIIVAHNHPSGDPTPSPEDRLVTEKLRQIGDLLDIPVLDHFVVGDQFAVSVLTGRHIV